MNVYADQLDYDDMREDRQQLEAFRSNPPHFLTVSAKEAPTNAV